MLFNDLPPEILTSIVSFATAHALTRQKRRKELLTLGRTCKALSQVCLRQIYGKLAYEISLKGLKLLATLNKGEDGARYASMVRALAIRERESGIQRRPINSREVEDAGTGTNAAAPTARATAAMTTRAKRMALDAILLEEKRISDLLALVRTTLVELKHETNLLPKDDLAFGRLANLQSLAITAQPPYPDAMDRESLLQVATFTLSLPEQIFLPAFRQLSTLTTLELWRCSFASFATEELQRNAPPSFRLQRLALEECTISGDTLDWLLQETLKAATLRELQYTFLSDTSHGKSNHTLAHALKRTLQKAAPHLEVCRLDVDDGELDEGFQDSSTGDDSASEALVQPSVLSRLGELKRLYLSGRSITEHHWKAVPERTLQSLQALAIHFTPALPPLAIVESLRNIDAHTSRLKDISLKGSEDFKRRNLREMQEVEPSNLKSEWIWTKEEFVTFVSLAQSREIQYVADRTIVVGDADEDDASSSADEYVLEDVDETGDFYVTQEQWDMEKAIEAEELERTWESGSEY